MSLDAYKLTNAQIAEKGVVAAPTVLSGTADENKRVFDRLIREAVMGAFNGLIDALTELGVEGTVLLKDGSPGFAGMKYVWRLGDDLYTSVDGSKWSKVAGKHTILDNDGNTMSSLQKLQFKNCDVTEDDTTITVSAKQGARGEGGSNGNLLDNWYFLRPVNQRMVASKTVTTEGGAWGGGYGLDRWRSNCSGITIDDNGLQLSSTGGTTQYLEQRLELKTAEALAGKTVTMSLLYSENGVDTLRTTTEVFPEIGWLSARTWSDFPWRFEFGFEGESPSYGVVRLAADSAAALQLKAVKLELGAEQTLARQVDGGWFLREIPDYGAELARCQRYCFAPFIGGSIFTRTTFVGTGIVQFFVSTPVTLRTNPVLESGTVNVGAWGSTGLAQGFTYTYTALRNSLRILASKAGHGLSDMWMDLNKVIFSADL